MHELSIVEAMVSIILEKARAVDARRVVRVYLVIGELSGVLNDAVELYFSFLTKDTIAAGAELFFQRPPTLVRCRNCGTEYCPENMRIVCPRCREEKIEIISGRELYIDNMEVE
ncbi:MAG: hydrogenase maturation nickel metallochaperone HypA [Dehalococcoidales bacterium]|nr:hydrogenase maturation nickel metallochaperone HypA [Dehalococcoidales bacterium]